MWLTVRSGPERGRSFAVDGERFVVGRDEDCDLSLPDSKVSRQHASLERLADGRLALRDLGSSNGTYVNGERVTSAFLEGREQIQLGNTVLVSSLAQPRTSRTATALGTIDGLGSQTASAVQRLVLQRSVRRATAVGAAALLAAVTLGLLGAAGLFSSSSSRASAVERVVREAAKATVPVQAFRLGAPVESGTGWVLDRQRGLIVTNAHVINGGTTFEVGAGRSSQPGAIVGVAPCEDLALLKVRDTTGLAALPLGSQSSLQLGETVVAVGYPVNASQEASLTSTTGVVSVLRSAYREPALDVPHYSDVVQTDAAINPGNSGGPLLDLDGKLVGVTSAARTLSASGRVIQGQNYAIGVDRVREVVRVLRSGRSLGWSGASFEYLAPAELRRRHLPPGLFLDGTVPGTPAAQARLPEGALLVAVNGLPVSSLASYCDAVGGISSGEKVAFDILEPGASAPRTFSLALK